MKKTIDILNTFLLADIPEIITQDEFDEVQDAIRNLITYNEKLEDEIKIKNDTIKVLTNILL